MNKVYRHIWSKTLGRMVVIAECMPGGGHKTSKRRKITSLLVASTALATPGWAGDLPTGGQIVAGSGSIAVNGNAMAVSQNTDKMIANWQSFSIGAGNSVTFNQPGASSVALNRVVGQDPSQILGALNANGQVFLVNPNGVVIGKGASVQTGGFVASTLGITNEDFLGRNYKFKGKGGSIVNQGSLSGKVVALISPTVSNEGTIKGDAALAAGTDVLLDFDGDGLLSVEVQASTVQTLVENKGLIKADGGTAILTAKGASDALKGVVNNSGTIEAKTLAKKNGRILLLGDMRDAQGEVNAAGSLKANFVETSAAKVNLDKDLKVETNGGKWLIDPTDITIDAASASAIETGLASGNVEMSTAGAGTDAGDIAVNASITWNANTLTLRADNDITINAELTSTGTTANDGLVLQYAQTTSTGDYFINAPVNLAAGGLFETQHGADAVKTYTVLTDIDALQDMTLSGNYVLGAHIDASETATWDEGRGFLPIAAGASISGFTGIFDGLGHGIANLTINRPSMDAVGLFGMITGGTLRNVTLDGGSIRGGSSVGALAGVVQGGVINGVQRGIVEHVYSSANVEGGGLIGGLVGNSDYALLRDVHSTGNATGTLNSIGGLVGLNSGTIEFASASGAVRGPQLVGGLVGANHDVLHEQTPVIRDSHASGAVTGGQAVGGLVGENIVGVIRDSYATGAVHGDENVGGLVGYNSTGKLESVHAHGNVTFGAGEGVGGLIGRHQNQSSVQNAYATGDVTISPDAAGSLYTGGLIGYSHGDSIVRNAYATGNVTGHFDVGGLIGKTNGQRTARLDETLATIEYVYATGNVRGADNVGGLIGYHRATMADGSVSARHAYAAGRVEFEFLGDNTGGLVGFNQAPITDSFWDVETTGMSHAIGVQSPISGSVTLRGLTTAQMQDPFTFIDAGWDLGNIWGKSNAGGNKGYIILRDVGPDTAYGDYVRLFDTDKTKTYGDANPSLGDFGFMQFGMMGTVSLAWNSAVTTRTDAGTYAYADGNVVDVTTTSAGGAYVDYGNGALTIDKRSVSLSDITVSNKIYDGTPTASLDLSSATFANMISGDDLTLATGSGVFADKNAGTDKTITISGLSLGGDSAGNYSLDSDNFLTTGTIDTRSLLFDVLFSNNRTYNGTDRVNASISSPSNVIAGDDVSLSGDGFVRYDNKNVGTDKDIILDRSKIVISGGDAGNYYISGGTTIFKGNINPRALSLTGVTAQSRTYDGTTDTLIDAGAASLAGVIGGDNVTFVLGDVAGRFSDKNVGDNKSVQISGVTLEGADAFNYSFDGTTSATASITPATLSISEINVANKTYDGTRTAVLDPAAAILSGIIDGDTVQLTPATGEFSDKNAGRDKAVTFNGLTLTGADAGNYSLDSDNFLTTGTIDTRSLLFDVLFSNNRTYNGTDRVNASISSPSNVIAGDDVSLSGDGFVRYDNKNVGTDKDIILDRSKIVISGGDAGNYHISGGTTIFKGNINPRALSLTGLMAQTKTYDGTTDAVIDTSGVVFSGTIVGDDLTLAHATGAFENAAAGENKAVTLTGLTLGGADALNYTLGNYGDVTGTIERAIISSVTGITAQNKSYDGTTDATIDASGAVFVGLWRVTA